MVGTFKFEVVSPERILLSNDAEQVVAPGSEGEFTVLPGHAPVISLLRPGVIDVQLPEAKVQRLFVKGGFVEVEPERMTILTPRAIDLATMDAATIAEELRGAEEEFTNAKDDAGKRAAFAAVEQLKALQARKS
jgi:F-type H+-transporting ATPase subunit epsilon